LNLEKQVYLKLLKVPKGKVTTYKELAKAVGLENGQRFIGQIMKKNPYPVIIPCHRVINSNGKTGGYFFGDQVKIKMLSKEGFLIKQGKVVNFEKKVYRF